MPQPKNSLACGRVHRIAVAVFLVVVLAGCSHDASPNVRVEGQVTYRGKPVTSGSIAFTPLEDSNQFTLRPAAGALKPDGTYCLNAYHDKQGILPGKYAVAVTAYRNPHQLPKSPGEIPEYSLPVKYVNPHTSGLTATVPTNADDSVRFDFELRD